MGLRPAALRRVRRRGLPGAQHEKVPGIRYKTLEKLLMKPQRISQLRLDKLRAPSPVKERPRVKTKKAMLPFLPHSAMEGSKLSGAPWRKHGPSVRGTSAQAGHEEVNDGGPCPARRCTGSAPRRGSLRPEVDLPEVERASVCRITPLR